MLKPLFKAICICLIIGSVSLPKPALAHTLARDGKISAFLHIAPNDKPLPGKINTVHIYYNDQDFRFTTEGCDCKIKVTDSEKVLYNGSLPAVAPRVGELKVLLPDNNISYRVAVSGVPKTAGFFQPFKLNFDIDVGHPPPDKPKQSNTGEILAGLSAVIVLVTAASYYKLSRRPPKT